MRGLEDKHDKLHKLEPQIDILALQVKMPSLLIRDPWSNPLGIDRPEGGLKTQSPHITHISAYGFTEYSIPSRSTVHTCMLMGLILLSMLIRLPTQFNTTT